jgi:hypothetical protein
LPKVLLTLFQVSKTLVGYFLVQKKSIPVRSLNAKSNSKAVFALPGASDKRKSKSPEVLEIGWSMPGRSVGFQSMCCG